jgi:hypothetical protein
MSWDDWEDLQKFATPEQNPVMNEYWSDEGGYWLIKHN